MLKKVSIRSVYSVHSFVVEVDEFIQVSSILIVQASDSETSEFINVTFVVCTIPGALHVHR